MMIIFRLFSGSEEFPNCTLHFNHKMTALDVNTGDLTFTRYEKIVKTFNRTLINNVLLCFKLSLSVHKTHKQESMSGNRTHIP